MFSKEGTGSGLSKFVLHLHFEDIISEPYHLQEARETHATRTMSYHVARSLQSAEIHLKLELDVTLPGCPESGVRSFLVLVYLNTNRTLRGVVPTLLLRR